jgi:hypothetical protein
VLSAHGSIVHLRDGSLAFMLSGNTRDEFVLQLAARCSRGAWNRRPHPEPAFWDVGQDERGTERKTGTSNWW